MSYTDMAAFCVSEFEHVLTTFLAKHKTSKAMLSATPQEKILLTKKTFCQWQLATEERKVGQITRFCERKKKKHLSHDKFSANCGKKRLSIYDLTQLLFQAGPCPTSLGRQEDPRGRAHPPRAVRRGATHCRAAAGPREREVRRLRRGSHQV